MEFSWLHVTSMTRLTDLGKKFKPWKYSSLEAGLGAGWWAGRDPFLLCPWYSANKHLSLFFFFFKGALPWWSSGLRICLQMPGDPDSVPSPGKMTHFREATKPAHRNYWSPRTECRCSPAREAPSMRSPRSTPGEQPPVRPIYEKPVRGKDPAQPKINASWKKDKKDQLEKNDFETTYKIFNGIRFFLCRNICCLS